MKGFLILFFFSLFSGLPAVAQQKTTLETEVERDLGKTDQIRKQKEEPRISNKYYRGEFLIFDCEDQHFACVNFLSFNLCKDRRKEDFEERRARLRCAPLKEFSSQEECFKGQRQQVDNPKARLFCFNPKYI